MAWKLIAIIFKDAPKTDNNQNDDNNNINNC